jgi:hypothetical protein
MHCVTGSVMVMGRRVVLTHVCDLHRAAGTEAAAEPVTLYDPFTGKPYLVDLCPECRAKVRGGLVAYLTVLRQHGHAPDAELTCTAGECTFIARNVQGLSRHITADHPELVTVRCPEPGCGEPTQNLKHHRWRKHRQPDGKDDPDVQGITVCPVCGLGGFEGPPGVTAHLRQKHRGEMLCPLGCGAATMLPDQHIRLTHGTAAYRRWKSAQRAAAAAAEPVGP